MIVTALLTGCGNERVYKQQSYVFGTLVEISIYGEPEARAKQLATQVLTDLDRLNATWHPTRPGTLQRMNAVFAQSPARAAIAPGMIPVMRVATELSLRSDGLFNPAIGNLIHLWGFQGDEFLPVRPDPRQVQALVQANPKMSDIVVEGIEFYSRNPAVRVDLGGFAKGYALDLESDYLRGQKVKAALLNFGGNIMAIGAPGGRPWRVGIQHPRKPSAIATLDLKDGESIGTSGDYQRYFELDGKRYCHIIDPRTGYPAQGVEAVTVLVPRGPHSGALSDAASKPIFIQGAAGFPQSARKMGVASVMLIDAGGRLYLTRPMQQRITLLEKDASIAPISE